MKCMHVNMYSRVQMEMIQMCCMQLLILNMFYCSCAKLLLLYLNNGKMMCNLYQWKQLMTIGVAFFFKIAHNSQNYLMVMSFN